MAANTAGRTSPEKKVAKTSTERSRTFRAKIKNDPDKLAAARKKDRERKKEERSAKRANCSVEELKELRKRKREEMSKYRETKREKARLASLACTTVTVPETKKQTGGKKGAKKIKKRKSVQKSRTQKQKTLLKKKNAVLRTQQWRLKVKLQKQKESNTKSSPDPEPSVDGYSSYWTRRRAIKSVSSALPETPAKKADVIEALTKSPRTNKLLQSRGVLLSPDNVNRLEQGEAVMRAMKENIDQVKPKGGSEKRQLFAYKIIKHTIMAAPLTQRSKLRSALKKYFHVKHGCISTKTRDWWKMKERKKRKDSLKEETVNTVKSFFFAPEVSRQVPGKTEVVKTKDASGTKVSLEKYVMIMTLDEAYKKFKEQYPNLKIGLSSFKKIKPVNVKKISETSRRTCLCTTCCNLALKIESLKKLSNAVPECKSMYPKLNKASLRDSVLCQYENKPKYVCLERSCQSCPMVQDFLPELNNLHDENIIWHHWEYILVLKDDVQKRCISCVEKTTTVQELIACLSEDLEKYPFHAFRADWQHNQMGSCIENLASNPNQVVLLMDYSENYRCSYKDEVQSGWFDQQQVTIHPMMAYYTEDEKLVKHAIIGISPDQKHDSELTTAFEEEALKILRNQPSLSNMNQVIEFTDGCASQYKCKTAFAHISTKSIGFHRNYFETSHGKSPCDGLGSVVKNSLYRAVVSGKSIISDAKAVLKHCLETLAHGKKLKSEKEFSKWDFVYVNQLQRPPVTTSLITLKGTQKIHSVKSVSTPYIIKARQLSCYCNSCRCDDPSPCVNKEWVQPWAQHSLVQGKDQVAATPNSSANATDLNNGNSTIIDVGCFVAIKIDQTSRPSRRNLKHPLSVYMAEVLEYDEDEVFVKFMRKSGQLYTWTEEKTWQPSTDVLLQINAPILLNEREQFLVNEQDIKTIVDRYGADYSKIYFK